MRLFRPVALAAPTVYLDDKKVEGFLWARPYEVSAGGHELRIEAEGYKPIIKQIHFGEDDPGELWLEITADDLHPLSAETSVASRSS